MTEQLELVVIVPSHNRPNAVRELVESFRQTCRGNTRLLFAVDEGDPQLEAYQKLGREASIVYLPSHNMVEALNLAALYVQNAWAEDEDIPFIGFMGDDHRPRTTGWDVEFVNELRIMGGTGIVYGNDLYQGVRLPTECVMSSNIIKALGFMAPPRLKHMYVDNFWRDLGEGASCLSYLPEVVIEHVHPHAGKAPDDGDYQRVRGFVNADSTVYAAYVKNELSSAINKVRALRGRHFVQQASNRELEPMVTGVAHEWRLFTKDTVPEYTCPGWYAGREHTPHLEQAGHRDRLMQTASFVAQAALQGGTDRTLVDLGAGDGGLLSLLGPAIAAWGYDLMPANLGAAWERGVDVRYGDVINDELEWGSIAVATEMLEHLVDPHAFVRRIGEHSQFLICSSPYLERPGNAYEFHTWAWDLEGYRALVEQGGFRVTRQRCVGPFQVILAVRS